MKTKVFAIAAILAAISMSAATADVITRWNFNRDAGGALPASPTSPAASTGTGTASLFGGVNATGTGFASGTVNGGSSEGTTPPSADPLGNNAWQINASWDPNGASLSQGAQFAASTAGFADDVVVTWDLRQSNSSSRFSAFQYTINGADWLTLTDASRITVGTNPLGDGAGSVTAGGLLTRSIGDRWMNQNRVDLSGLGAGNNALFAFRVVAAHDPSGTTFVRTDTGLGPISATGTWRFDAVTISATAVPEPSSAVLIGSAFLGMIAYRRRR
ncbi:MAG: PEP-CTERM sorting domain-containing protein [Planctomycetaceae bacterium]|nr:PEP-CTERM sorting domain-containing protein [Planctomycetaceae bacterium]